MGEKKWGLKIPRSALAKNERTTITDSIQMYLNAHPLYNDYKRNYMGDKFYYGITITIPAKKIITFRSIHRKPYGLMEEYEQKEYLSFLFNAVCNEFEVLDFEYTFEQHPNRNNGFHIHGYICVKSFIASSDVFYDFILKMSDIKVCSKIMKFEFLETEMNLVNWINYMYKEVEGRQLLFTKQLFYEFIADLKMR